MKNIISLLLFLSILSIKAQNKTELYIIEYSSIAIEEMNKYNIPASITLAQGILESGSGESRLALEANNHFGIKCHENWNGESIIADDDKEGECFRKYPRSSDSYRDHSLFLTERSRYSFLFLLNTNNYKGWARGLKKAGYATNPEYATLLIDLIKKYDLSRFDKMLEKKFYFAHSYGAPYLSGIGAYYFKKRSLYAIEVNTSFLFSETNFGYHQELLNKLYVGINTGIIYLPSKQKDIIPQIAGELSYKKQRALIRIGAQIPLDDLKYKIIPFLKFTYLIY